MRTTKIPKERSHSGMEIKGWSKDWVKLLSPDHSISNVFLVDSLDYNLLFVSQLCKMGYNYLFTDTCVTVFRRSDDSVAFKGVLEGQCNIPKSQPRFETLTPQIPPPPSFYSSPFTTTDHAI
jgi:hypothetical protein